MIRTKSFAYVIAKYALAIVCFLVLTLIMWGVLFVGAALLGHTAPEYGTASDVTFILLMALFVIDEVGKEIERRRARRDGWTPVD